MDFKLPIEYTDCHTIDNVVRKDLEILTTDEQTNLYKKILNSDSGLIDRWSSVYTCDKSFLKDTQKCIKRYKTDGYNTGDFQKEYTSFISETNFTDKYQYIGMDAIRKLNDSSLFLHCLGLYNLGSPIISLCTPLFILIVPFIVLKAKGINVTINMYIESLKNIMKTTSIYKLFSDDMGSQQRVSAIVSIFIYCLQVYNNVISCIHFYKNINVVYSFLMNYRQYLIETDKRMFQMIQHLSRYKTYGDFLMNLRAHHLNVTEWIHKLNQIHHTEHTIVKIGQLGTLMQMYYELYYSSECRDTYSYTLNLHHFNNDMLSFHTLVKSKKIGKCKFGAETNLKDMFYLAHINDEYKTNNVTINKNILLTGPNASGKTTVLKSIILNVLLSQQLGYGCYRKADISCYDTFHSYLNIPDTSGRDSLFQAEARRCQDIISNITNNRDKKHLCIFDEIYSGTNPSDAITCAILYLKDMNKHTDFVDYIITTHYTDLCESFKEDNDVVNMKMDVNVIDDENIKYTYKMIDGISYVNGGKHILRQMIKEDIRNN